MTMSKKKHIFSGGVYEAPTATVILLECYHLKKDEDYEKDLDSGAQRPRSLGFLH